MPPPPSLNPPDPHQSQNQTLYLAYGSNLWLHQMSLRCPSSVYVGVARLPHYRWIINARGYANVVFSAGGDEVWGLAYSLTEADEASLDRNEGVPHAYTKEIISVDLFPSSSSPTAPFPHSTRSTNPLSAPLNQSSASLSFVPGSHGGETVKMLIYIDRLRVVPAKPRLEYIQRMNRGIEDALEKGVPGWWVEKVVRGFIPAEGRGEGGGGGFLKEKGMGEGGWGDGVGELAERQARGFVEEE